MDPQLGEWAIEGLKTLAPDKAIPFKVAVEKGLKIREVRPRGTSARLTNTATGAWCSPAL